MHLYAYGITDIGNRRANNEDALILARLSSPAPEKLPDIVPLDAQLPDEDDILLAVSDGVGGDNAGEVASYLALTILHAALCKTSAPREPAAPTESDESPESAAQSELASLTEPASTPEFLEQSGQSAQSEPAPASEPAVSREPVAAPKPAPVSETPTSDESAAPTNLAEPPESPVQPTKSEPESQPELPAQPGSASSPEMAASSELPASDESVVTPAPESMPASEFAVPPKPAVPPESPVQSAQLEPADQPKIAALSIPPESVALSAPSASQESALTPELSDQAAQSEPMITPGTPASNEAALALATSESPASPNLAPAPSSDPVLTPLTPASSDPVVPPATEELSASPAASVPAIPSAQTDQDVKARFLSAILETDAAIRREAERFPDRAGMAATLTALWLHNGKPWLGQVGDSRLYRLRAGNLEQLSNEHSPVGRMRRAGQISEDAARNHRFKNVIDQALGGDAATPVPKPDVDLIDLQSGDIVLICSDGLVDGLTDARLKANLDELAAGRKPLVDTTTAMVEEAKKSSGRDNITIIVARFD